ncbi:hypothetical protein HanRHA438_Chr16g0771381 [Helianthus annuus]|nr:hypothetical protein HanRHA438_Chr16g0771381 [Helianthus annuus]
MSSFFFNRWEPCLILQCLHKPVMVVTCYKWQFEWVWYRSKRVWVNTAPF